MAGAVRASQSPLAILHLIVSSEISFLHSAWCVCVCLCVLSVDPLATAMLSPAPFSAPEPEAFTSADSTSSSPVLWEGGAWSHRLVHLRDSATFPAG